MPNHWRTAFAKNHMNVMDVELSRIHHKAVEMAAKYRSGKIRLSSS